MMIFIKLIISFVILAGFLAIWAFYGNRLRDWDDVVKGIMSLTAGLIIWALLIGLWVQG